MTEILKSALDSRLILAEQSGVETEKVGQVCDPGCRVYIYDRLPIYALSR